MARVVIAGAGIRFSPEYLATLPDAHPPRPPKQGIESDRVKCAKGQIAHLASSMENHVKVWL
jgi:hypothetical protein